jgi:hypothetical protein
MNSGAEEYKSVGSGAMEKALLAAWVKTDRKGFLPILFE